MSDQRQFGMMDSELLGWLDGEAKRRGVSRRAMVEAMLGALRRQIEHGRKQKSEEQLVADGLPPMDRVRRIVQTPVEGFVGSRLPGHRDVPVLGWYRPSSAEARGPDERASRLPD
jgi:hypothetical protein